ncbi:inhibitor of apoptosis-promoting Bax1-domain-containing protein [Blastocladiella britannica]|nr:inhibitor of apoptosis-promoting Bax1-domain-containing protein [Blastocladiella britannica]
MPYANPTPTTSGIAYGTMPSAPPPDYLATPAASAAAGRALEDGIGFGDHKPVVFECEQAVRNAFIAKVAAIVFAQLALTAVISAVLTLLPNVQQYIVTHTWTLWVNFALTLVFLVLTFWKRHSAPTNFILLTLFTASEALMVGVIVASYSARSVVQALILTAGMVGALMAFASYAAKKNMDLSALGVVLSVALMGLVVTSLIGIFFPFGSALTTVYCVIGAVVFSGYIVFDTWRLMTVHPPDEYIAAALDLYLDVINLFLYILQLIGDRDN